MCIFGEDAVVVEFIEGVFVVVSGSWPGGFGGASAGSGHTTPGLCGTHTLELTSKTVSPAHDRTSDTLCSH